MLFTSLLVQLRALRPKRARSEECERTENSGNERKNERNLFTMNTKAGVQGQRKVLKRCNNTDWYEVSGYVRHVTI